MASRVGVGNSTNRQSAAAGREAAGAAMSNLGAQRPGLVLVFSTVGYDQVTLLRAITAVTGPAPLSGCSGEGVITLRGSDEGSHSVAVMAVASDQISFRTLHVRGVSRDPRGAAHRLCAEARHGGRPELGGGVSAEGGANPRKFPLPQPGSSCTDADVRAMLLFPDGLTINCTELLEEIQRGLPYPITLAGGSAGDALRFERSFQYHDGEVDSDSLSAVLIGGRVCAEIAISHGSDLVGIERTVTRAEGGRVQEINGRPAWGELREFLGEAEGISPLSLAYLCLAERLPGEGDPEYGQYVVRVPLGLDRSTGTVFFPGGLATGARFQMARRNRDRIQQHALASVQRLAERHPGRQPLCVLQFDCAGRGRLLYGEHAGEAIVEPLQRALGKDVPWAGFHSYGEIGPLLGRSYYHNYTVVLCALYEDDGAEQRAPRPKPAAAATAPAAAAQHPSGGDDDAATQRMFNAQLREILRAEHQLYSSQLQVEHQLDRTHALNRFALAASAREALDVPKRALVLAAQMLFEVTPYEQAVAWLADPSGEVRPVAVVARSGREADSARALERSTLDLQVHDFAKLRSPLLVGPSTDDPAVGALCRSLEELFHEEGSGDPRGGPAHLILPLRRDDGALQAILALRSIAACVTYHDPLPGPDDLPFFKLVCAHVEGALEGAVLRRQLADLATDLEERVKQRTAELAQKNQFLAMLSHELRSPLAPIRNSVYILERAEPSGSQAKLAKAIIGRQVDHLAHLVDDLLDVTRIACGKVQLSRGYVELGEIVRRAVEDHSPEFAPRHIALELQTSSEPLWIDADPNRISQVISNLLQNAAKFTNAQGHVTVTVGREADTAIVRVADDGMGIAPEILPRLFQPFMQADQSIHRPRGGLGLGLALVKGLVELHGGTVAAQSGGIGRGAEFTVRLHLPKAHERPARHPIDSRGKEGGALDGRRVLIVEDNEDHAETLRALLALGGHVVEEAHDGRTGVEKAHAFNPDVVLCDLGLPGMNGFEVARSIRADPTLASTVLVAVTGYTLPEDRRKSAAAGFDHHLAKPVTFEQLKTIVTSSAHHRVGSA